MIAVEGKYKDGKIELLHQVNTHKTMKVIVTFLDEDYAENDDTLNLDTFNFSKSRKILKNIKSSFSDTVCEERRFDL